MTLYYDEDLDALVEGHGLTYAQFVPEHGVGDDEGLVFDLSERQKRSSLLVTAEEAQEAHRCSVECGDSVTLIGADEKHDALVTEVWNEHIINCAYVAGDGLVTATSVPREDPTDQHQGVTWDTCGE